MPHQFMSAEDEILCRGSGLRIWDMQQRTPENSPFTLAAAGGKSENIKTSRHSSQILAYYTPAK